MVFHPFLRYSLAGVSIVFLHGIPYHYLIYQYPILSPRRTILPQTKRQRKDRQHLIERFGFEPVHFLESGKTYSIGRCISSCFSFGNVILVYKKLPLPMLQLSPHEVGVPVVDARQADFIVIDHRSLINKVRKIFKNTPIFFSFNLHNIEKCRKIVRWKKGVKSVRILDK